MTQTLQLFTPAAAGFRFAVGAPWAWPAAKRAMDMAGAALLLVLLAPVFLALAVAARADGGPVFYAHRRIGRGGAELGCLRFRSRRTDAARALRDLLARDPAARAEW